MVGKKIPNPKAGSSKASRIGGLVDYIDRPQSQSNDEKCVYSNGINFVFETSETQRAEMISLALAAPRSKDPVDHYVLSWKEGEQPTPEQCDEAAKTLLERLGVQDHQCRYALHHDTNNFHMHALVNRAHPDTEKVKHVEYPVNKLHEALALIEHKQGWERENRGLYMVNESGDPVRTVDERTAEPKVSAKANSVETLTGERSAERIAIEDAAPILRAAQSWEQLHEQLSKRGISYETKGSGAILRVGDQAVKASAAGRDCSLAALQKRLGTYRSAQPQVDVLPRTAEPARPDAAPGWNDYAKARREYFETKNAAWNELRSRHQAERAALKAVQKRQRQERLGGGKWHGHDLSSARSILAAQQAGERAALSDGHKGERQCLQQQMGRVATYEQWLLQQGKHDQAQQWRFRQADNKPQIQSIIGTTQDEKPTPRDIRSFNGMVDEKNRRVLYSRAGEQNPGFIDRGKAVDVLTWKDQGTMLAAMQLSAQKWGGRLTVNGTDEYKAQCVELAVQNGWTITNPELQHAQEQAKLERFRTARPEHIPTPARSNVEVYNRHRDDVRARLPGPLATSRLDWMVGNRMRMTGHTQQAIADTLKQCGAQQRPDEQRDWKKYADHTAAAVFGERGNREQDRLGKYADAWARIEGRDLQDERDAARKAAIAEQQELEAKRLQAQQDQKARENDQGMDM